MVFERNIIRILKIYVSYFLNNWLENRTILHRVLGGNKAKAVDRKTRKIKQEKGVKYRECRG